MPFTAQELANIGNGALDFYFAKGDVWANAIQQKPLMRAFDANAGTFSGGKGEVSLGIKQGGSGGALSLAGYTHDDVVDYGNPATGKRLTFPWKEHHMGLGLTHTELKHDGITVNESGGDQTTSEKDGREEHALANLFKEKTDDMNEQYAQDWDALLHGDGSGDVKSIAGIGEFILADPALGSTGGMNRTTNTWFRNRAATAAALAAGSGPGEIASAPTNGGVLLQFLQKEKRQLMRYARGGVKHFCVAGSDFIDAMEVELRANGLYTQRGFSGRESVDGAMATDEGVPFGKWNIVYDPTLDDLGLEKRLYAIDMKRIKLLYMSGEKMKKANPSRPYDRYVMYKGITTTAVMVCQQLNTSAVYDIA